MNKYTIKSTFRVYERGTDKLLAEFENEEITTTDKNEHSVVFGEGHRKACAFIESHGGYDKEYIVRKIHRISEEYDYSNSGSVYLKWNGEEF